MEIIMLMYRPVVNHVGSLSTLKHYLNFHGQEIHTFDFCKTKQ